MTMTHEPLEELDIQEIPPDEPVRMVTLRMRRTRPEELGVEDNNANVNIGPAVGHTTESLEANIQFVERLAIVRSDHPLLDYTLRNYPVEIVEPEDKTRIWMDPDTGKEYKSERAYRTAQQAKKNKG